MSVVSNNPSFGLNALGGAVSILMKDGFSYQGGEVDLMAGSFGRRQVGVQAGGAAATPASTSPANGSRTTASATSPTARSALLRRPRPQGHFRRGPFQPDAADKHFGATAAAPIELLDRSWSNTFTSPQTTDLEVYMPSISASVKATDTLTLLGCRLLPPLQEPRGRRQPNGNRGMQACRRPARRRAVPRR